MVRNLVCMVIGQDVGESDSIISVMKIGGMELTQYIQKPIDGNALDKAIVKLAPEKPNGDIVETKRNFADTERELIIYEDRITLCGVEVWQSTFQDDIKETLQLLSQKDKHGYLYFKGARLNAVPNRDISNSIAKPIKDFRDRCTELMATHRQIKCGRYDVIGPASAGGYHLKANIEVREANKANEPTREPDIKSDRLTINDRQQ